MSNFRLLLLLSCALLLSRSLVPQEPAWAQERSPSSDLIETQLGDLPIILSAPHDGARDIPQAKPRSGEGLEAKPGGFVTARDTGTAPLALAIASALEKRLHRKPYVVVNRAHRKFMDPNRSPSEAFEEPATQSVYEEYHRFLTDACQQVRQKFRTGLLLDIQIGRAHV